MTAKKLERSKTMNWILRLHYFTTELIKQVTQCDTEQFSETKTISKESS